MATLVIGIGSSALGVLEAAQQFNYEFTGQNTPVDVEYMFIDTEKASKARSTPTGKTSIHKIAVPLDGIEGEIARLKANKSFDSSWFPSDLKVEAESGAAGGRPTYGRLALWVYYNDIDSYLKQFATKQGEKKVLVVGSLTGGTGSGICVDLAYLIRHRIPKADLQAVFMIPSESDYADPNKVVYENSFQALKSLEYYSIPENIYNNKTPVGVQLKYSKAPYDIISVVSQDYDESNSAVGASKMEYLSELIRSVGLYVSTLFLPAAGESFKEILGQRRKDAITVSNHMKHFSSFGISLAQYPSKILEEYLALEYSKKIISHWKNAKVKSNSIENQAKKNIEKHINNALNNTLNVKVNNINLNQYISNVVENILNKKFENYDDFDSYLDDLLKKEGVIYNTIVKNLDDAKRTIIKNINNDLNNILVDPRFKASKEYLQATAKYLSTENDKSILNFWDKTYKVNGKADRWPSIFKHLKDKVKSEMKEAKPFLQLKQLLNERITDIVLLLKMNLTYNMLKSIATSIQDKDQPLFAQGARLINLDDVDNLSKTLEELDNTSNASSFAARQSYIKANNKSYAQVYYFYKKGNFDNEISDLKRKINGAGGIDETGVTLLNGSSLFDFLTKNKTFIPKETTDLYFSILPNIINQINQKLAQTQPTNNDIYSMIFADVNDNAVKRFLSADEGDLKMSPPAFMAHSVPSSSHGLFNYSPCLKLLYASNDVGKIQSVANNIRKNNSLNQKTITDAPPTQNAAKIPALDDAILIFREYAYYGGNGSILDTTLVPTRNNRSMYLIKDTMINNINDEEFVINRLPYFNQLKQTQNVDITSEFKKLANHDTSQ